MILCHCKAVSDRKVHAALELGATAVEDITAACGAAGDCGACRPAIEAIIDDHAWAMRSAPVALRVAS